MGEYTLYKGFYYECEDRASETALRKWIDSLGDNPTEIPDVSDENYERWHCDYNFKGVKTLVLAPSIKRIGKCAFAQSEIEHLTSFNVKEVDELAFYNTKKLKGVALHECVKLVTTDRETGEDLDGSDCFNHSHVQLLYLPKVEKVGRYCFYDMPNIQKIWLPLATSVEPYAIYGNENLVEIELLSLETANFAIITNNKKLNNITAPKIKTMVQGAIEYNGTDCEVELPDGVELVAAEQSKNPLSDQMKTALKQTEAYSYDFEYKGFKVNFIEGMSKAETTTVIKQLKSLIDIWHKERMITDSPNLGADESGHVALMFVKDILIPEQIEAIGDYAFAKCYNLESIIGNSVLRAGDHAFYCDGQLRYVELRSCETLVHDAFNGAGYDRLEEDFPKIFIPNVQGIGAHAFWQTGFVKIDAPKSISVHETAFEENQNLKYLGIGRIEENNTLYSNPSLAEVVQNVTLNSDDENDKNI